MFELLKFDLIQGKEQIYSLYDEVELEVLDGIEHQPDMVIGVLEDEVELDEYGVKLDQNYKPEVIVLKFELDE